MADSESHSEGMLVEPNFCTLRKKDDCGCGNDYTAVAKEGWAEDEQYPQLLRFKGGARVTQWWSANAHHLLCVAEVTKVISKDESLQRVTKQSQWCVNHKHNMLALPLFSHTVLWYMFRGNDTKPGFVDLPNHNYDHGPYNEEVEGELNKIKATIKKAGHKYKPSKLAPTLNRKSTTFRSRLTKRGKRRGGTHKRWQAAMNDDEAYWYEPFSMADDGDVTKAVFPGRSFKEDVAKTFDRLMNAILNIK